MELKNIFQYDIRIKAVTSTNREEKKNGKYTMPPETTDFQHTAQKKKQTFTKMSFGNDI